MIWRRWVTESPSSATKARSERPLLAQRRACVRRPGGFVQVAFSVTSPRGNLANGASNRNSRFSITDLRIPDLGCVWAETKSPLCNNAEQNSYGYIGHPENIMLDWVAA